MSSTTTRISNSIRTLARRNSSRSARSCAIEIPRYVAAERAVFAGVPDSQLLNYGVPAEWLDDVKQVADEDGLLALADHLPAEAAEALLELATGSAPERPFRGGTDGDPFAHPDAQRRFRVMSNQEELRQALEYPWEKWTVFLHPAQRQIMERTYRGPARVSGSAGTGKTIVALHRAVHLARTHSDAACPADHVLHRTCGRVARTSGATHRQ